MSRYIDADALEKMLRNWISEYWTDAFTGDDAGAEFADMIDRAETLDVQPVVHAHWELDPDGMDFGLPAWRCSSCGGKNTMIPSFIQTKHGGYVPKNPYVFAGSNYCPHCGAKMDEIEKRLEKEEAPAAVNTPNANAQ